MGMVETVLSAGARKTCFKYPRSHCGSLQHFLWIMDFSYHGLFAPL